MKQDNIRNKVMNRIGWFMQLRVMFENSQYCTDDTVWKASFLNEFLSLQDTLPLKSIEEYKEKTEERGLSLNEVYNSIDGLIENKVTFDQIIDAVMNIKPSLQQSLTLPANRNRSSVNSMCTTYSKSLLANCSLAKLRKPLKDLKDLPSSLPEKLNVKNIRALKLSNQPIKQIKGLTQNITILNLSGCKLKSLKELEGCPLLELLNVADNLLSELPKLKTLKELYMSNNKFIKFPLFPSITLLDISKNLIASINHVRLTKLVTLLITETPLVLKKDYEIWLKRSFPALRNLNPRDICLYSSYLDVHELWQSKGKMRVQKKNDANMIANTFSDETPKLIKQNSRPSVINLANENQFNPYFLITPDNIKKAIGRPFNNPIAVMMIRSANDKIRSKRKACQTVSSESEFKANERHSLFSSKRRLENNNEVKVRKSPILKSVNICRKIGILSCKEKKL